MYSERERFAHLDRHEILFAGGSDGVFDFNDSLVESFDKFWRKCVKKGICVIVAKLLASRFP